MNFLITGIIIGFLPLMGWAGDTKDGKICWFILLAPKNLILLTIIAGGIPLLTVLVLYSVILYHAIKKIITLQRAARAEAQNKVVTTENGLRIFRGKTNVSDSETEDTNPSTNPQKGLFRRVFMRQPDSNVKSPSKWRAVKVVMFTSGSFLITWGPYFIAALVYSYCEDLESKRCKTLAFLIASPLAILGFMNSLINPIIYAWWHQGFRTFVVAKFNSLRKKRNSVSPSKNTSSTGTDKSSRSRSNSKEREIPLSSEVKVTPKVEVSWFRNVLFYLLRPCAIFE